MSVSKWILVSTIAIGVAACGTATNNTITGGGGGGGGGGYTPAATTVTVTKSVAGNLSAGGTMVVTANVLDQYGAAMPDSTIVDFTTSLAGTTITPQSTTTGGNATATFNANNASGTSTITATSGAASGTTTVTIDPSSTGSVTVASITPPEIGVKGGGMPEVCTVVFNVQDAYGNPVSDGTTVNFALNPALGGGENISSASGQTISGQVQVQLTSGTRAGIAGVTATEPVSGIGTTASVSILGGKGISSNFSIGTGKPSFEGYDKLNNTNDFTVVLGDIFGNAVKPGTLVTFQTEIGTIPSASTDNAGVATSTYTTLGSDPALRSKGPSFTGQTGWLTVLATAPGQEPFFDNNNNGVFDAGDTFTPALHDFGEPFLDADEDGAYDVGEFYSDTNQNGVYDGPNGVHDANTTIWNSIVVVLSTVNFQKPIQSLVGDTSTITVIDNNSNPVDAGTAYSASADVGNLTGNKASGVPFNYGYSLVTGQPTVPVYVPAFTNTTSVTRTDPYAQISVTITTPSGTYTETVW